MVKDGRYIGKPALAQLLTCPRNLIGAAESGCRIGRLKKKRKQTIAAVVVNLVLLPHNHLNTRALRTLLPTHSLSSIGAAPEGQRHTWRLSPPSWSAWVLLLASRLASGSLMAPSAGRKVLRARELPAFSPTGPSKSGPP